jgi:hypothetical protein
LLIVQIIQPVHTQTVQKDFRFPKQIPLRLSACLPTACEYEFAVDETRLVCSGDAVVVYGLPRQVRDWQTVMLASLVGAQDEVGDFERDHDVRVDLLEPDI